MADYTGQKAKAAFKKDRGSFGAGPAIAYPQVPGATDMAAGHQFAFFSDTLASNRERAPDESLVGSASQPVPDVYRKDGAGGIPAALRWRGLERQIMCALGFECAPTTNASPATLAAGAYRHLFEIDKDLVDRPWSSGDERAAGFNSNDRVIRRGQVGIYRGNEDWIYYSAFINKMTISGSPQEGVRIAFEYLAYDRLKGSYNSTNWTLPAGPTTRALFHQAQVRLGLRASGEGGVVEPYVNKWELSVDNHLSSEDQSSATGLYPEIPVRTEAPTVMLKFDRPRYTDRGFTDSSWLTVFDSDIELCAKIVIGGTSQTAPVIGATAFYHRIGLFMTSLKRTSEPDEPNIQGPSSLRNSWGFQAFSRDPATTDVFAAANYSGITLLKNSALVVTCDNADSGNYLLET